MKKISIYGALLALASCAAEEAPELESSVDSDSPRIVVCGGTTAPGATRADGTPISPEEPSQLGICKADMIKILHFKGVTTSGNAILAKNLTKIHEENTDLSKNINYRDKWTTHSTTLSLTASLNSWFAFPSIAYNSKDIDKFSFDATSYEDLKLNILSNTSTPELYFGRLLPVGTSYKSTNTTGDSHQTEDMRYKNNIYAWDVTDNLQLTGKLYRIVSQLNLNITEISPNVEQIEMYLSNVPTQIGLYAPHRTALGVTGTDRGYFYPIVEASGDAQHSKKDTDVLVCTITNDDYKDGVAKLSTFLLPSDRGRSVTVKARIKTFDTDKKGNMVETTVERIKKLRAAENYFLTEEDSKVYFSTTALPIYTASTNEFKSYPNVRVNVTGKLSDIFSEESESNVVIEICPNYDGEHNIEIK